MALKNRTDAPVFRAKNVSPDTIDTLYRRAFVFVMRASEASERIAKAHAKECENKTHARCTDQGDLNADANALSAILAIVEKCGPDGELIESARRIARRIMSHDHADASPIAYRRALHTHQITRGSVTRAIEASAPLPAAKVRATSAPPRPL